MIFQKNLFDDILLETGVETVFRVRVARVLRKVQLIHLSISISSSFLTILLYFVFWANHDRKFGEGGSQSLSYLCQNDIVVFASSAIVLYYLLYSGNGGVGESQIEVGVVYVDHII